MYISFHVHYPLFLSYFIQLEFPLKILEKYSNLFSWKSVQWKQNCSMRMDERTDRQADMTKLIAALHNFANVPKNVKNYKIWLDWLNSSKLQYWTLCQLQIFRFTYLWLIVIKFSWKWTVALTAPLNMQYYCPSTCLMDYRNPCKASFRIANADNQCCSLNHTHTAKANTICNGLNKQQLRYKF
jgi:hypothetical protein